MIRVWALCVFLCFPTFSWSQNYERQEEELELDAIREQKVKELLKERELEEERLRTTPFTLEELQERNLVEVEPTNVLPADLATKDPLVPYKIRRKDKGVEVGFIYSLFNPVNYESDYVTPGFGDFKTIYGDAETALMELYLTRKYNFFFGSIAFEFAYGTYENDVDDTSFGEIKLDLSLLRFGGRVILDNIMYEPIVAPYAGLGTYVMFYDETLNSNSFSGNTDPALYGYFGSMFQLNWIDKWAAADAYVEGGIENTFVFLELRKFMASAKNQDPDFETDIDLNIGLSAEF